MCSEIHPYVLNKSCNYLFCLHGELHRHYNLLLLCLEAYYSGNTVNYSVTTVVLVVTVCCYESEECKCGFCLHYLLFGNPWCTPFF